GAHQVRRPGAAFEVGPEPPARRRGGDAGDAARLDVSPRRADRGTRALPAPAARRHDRAEPMERGAAQPPAGAARGRRAAGDAVPALRPAARGRGRLGGRLRARMEGDCPPLTRRRIPYRGKPLEVRWTY